MKSIFTLIGSLLIYSLSAQSNFGLNEGANWQQYISTILGGNCVSISNVQYNADTNSAGYFENGQNVIGLNKGIVISTGKLSGQNVSGNLPITISSDFNQFLSSPLNLPGDPILTLVSGTTTNDASALEFDFTSPINSAVFVKYVFASEEYPEFAPPTSFGFNDIFGFFVSGGGFNNENIALLPNSTTPVSINSINAVTNPDYYLSSHPNLVYDGYTVPLTATFQAVAGVTYHLKIVIADGGDSAFDSAIFLESLELGIQQMSGTATLNGSPVTSGIVELFGLNTDSTQANLVASQDLSTGDFIFSDLEPASYILKVTPDPVAYPGALPKYFDQAYLWADATILSLPCSDYSFGLSLAPVPNGSGTVGGTVYSTTSNLKVTADYEDFQPAGNVNVWLFNHTNNEVVAHTKTNSSGVFLFENIEAGTYRINVDVTGLANAESHVFSINENETVNKLDYLIGKNKIIKYQESVSINDVQNQSLNVFPNPFVDAIQIKGLSTGNWSINIFDLSGRSLVSIHQNILENQTINLATESLQKGVYLLTAERNGERKQVRLIK